MNPNIRTTRTYWELRLAWEAADNRRHRIGMAIDDGAPFTAADVAEAQAAYEAARDALRAYEG